VLFGDRVLLHDFVFEAHVLYLLQAGHVNRVPVSVGMQSTRLVLIGRIVHVGLGGDHVGLGLGLQLLY